MFSLSAAEGPSCCFFGFIDRRDLAGALLHQAVMLSEASPWNADAAYTLAE